jgi:UDP-glucose 4-epimerase
MTILITGGLGFIGLHTARSLIDMGEDVVLTQYRVAREPDFIKADIGKRAFVEQLDVTDGAKLDDIGRRYQIDGIIHLATPGLGALDAAGDYNMNMVGLQNIFRVAEAWQVKRLGLASSVAVYTGEHEGPFAEDRKLRMTPTYSVEAYKKAFEVIGHHYAQRTGLEIVMLRIGGIYGPLYHSMANLPSRLVHAALKGEAPDFRGQDVFEDDTADICYVKDCGAGIANIQTAPTLPQRVYNIALGKATSNRELVDAIKSVVPGAKIDLKPGSGPLARANAYAEITRITQDTNYKAQWPVEKSIPDYVAWLRAGNAE